MVLSFAAGGRSFRSRVELVWLAETAVSAERSAALFDREEPTVSPARSSVSSAPFIGVSGGRTGDEGQRYREPSSNGEAFGHEMPPCIRCLVRHNTDACVLVLNIIATTSAVFRLIPALQRSMSASVARRRREHLQQTVERLLNQFIGADQDRGRHNFRCEASSRRRVMTMATATPPMEMDGLS